MTDRFNQRSRGTAASARTPGPGTSEPLSITTLAKTKDVAVSHITCAANSRSLSDYEVDPDFAVVFPQTGLFVRHYAKRSVHADPGVALFLNKHEAHRTSHPTAEGDRCLVLGLSDRFAEPYIDPSSLAFPHRAIPFTARSDILIRLLARGLAHGSVTRLALEEHAVAVVDRVLARDALPGSLTPHQSNLVGDAREYLAVNFATDAKLTTIAAAVSSSPHHLSRLFRMGTGSTMSHYRLQLRLRAAVEMIEKGAVDLSTVAVAVGFYDHAHLTNAFRKYAGMTPTAFRAAFAPEPPADDTITPIGRPAGSR